MKDLYKIVAFIFIYQEQVYGYRTVGLDTGRNNLESYFCCKLGWSMARLKRNVKLLREAGVLERVKNYDNIMCLKMSACKRIVKIGLKLSELDLEVTV